MSRIAADKRFNLEAAARMTEAVRRIEEIAAGLADSVAKDCAAESARLLMRAAMLTKTALPRRGSAPPDCFREKMTATLGELDGYVEKSKLFTGFFEELILPLSKRAAALASEHVKM